MFQVLPKPHLAETKIHTYNGVGRIVGGRFLFSLWDLNDTVIYQFFQLGMVYSESFYLSNSAMDFVFSSLSFILSFHKKVKKNGNLWIKINKEKAR